MQECFFWQVLYSDGRTASEKTIKYDEICFGDVREFSLIPANRNFPKIAYSIPRGSKPFLRRRRHVTAVSGVLKKTEYIIGYRFPDPQGKMLFHGSKITIAGAKVVGIAPLEELDIELHDLEKFMFEKENEK